MGNYRAQLNCNRCSEFLAKPLWFKSPESPLSPLTVKTLKRPKRRETNLIPDIPTGESLDKLGNERMSLRSKMIKKNNWAVIKDTSHIHTVDKVDFVLFIYLLKLIKSSSSCPMNSFKGSKGKYWKEKINPCMYLQIEEVMILINLDSWTKGQHGCTLIMAVQEL